MARQRDGRARGAPRAVTSRRAALAALGAGTAGLFAALGTRPQAAARAAGSRAQADSRPNIVLILTDDLDARSLEFMPNVAELLGRQGTTFANAFVTTPLCCPSRASILRGQYAHNHGVLGNGRESGGFDAFSRFGQDQSTIATWLQAAGYRTALVGKYLNGYAEGVMPYVPPGWDEWFALVEETGKVLQLRRQRKRATRRLRRPAGRLLDRRRRRQRVRLHPRRCRGRPALLPLSGAERPARPRHAGAPGRRRLPRSRSAAATLVQRSRRQRQAGVGARHAPAR